MERRGRGAADEDGDRHAAALELAADADHLVERGGDQTAQGHGVGADALRLVGDALRLDHHAEVVHLVAVAGHDDRDDVLADVVHVALHGGDHDAARRVSRAGLSFDARGQHGHGALHHAGALDHLRQEHAARAEAFADLGHGWHEQAVDHRDRVAELVTGGQGVGLDVVGDSLEHRAADALGGRRRVGSRFGGGRFGRLPVAHRFGVGGEPLGGVFAAAENHVLDPLEQLGGHLVVGAQQLRVDDARVHARADGVVEEGGVHRLADRVVAAEGEREVRDAARDADVRAALLDRACGVDEGLGVAVVGGDARGYGQDVGIEDDRLGREAVGGEQAVGAFGYLDLAFAGVSLSPLVEEHHDGRGTVAADAAGPFEEALLALLERDRVDHGATLRHLETRFDHLPARRVDHHGDAGDLGLGGHEIEEGAHRLDAVDQAVVHADVDHLGPGFDLGARHGEGLFVAVLADEAGETGRSGDVRALADVDEVLFGRDFERLQTAQYGDVPRRGERARRIVADDLAQLEDMGGGGAAAAADDVHQPAAQVFGQIGGEHFGRLVIAAHEVRQPRVGVGRDAAGGDLRQPLEVGEQLAGPEGAVQADREQVGMLYGGAQRLDGLPREGAAAAVGERPREHDGEPAARFGGDLLDGEEGRFGVERVENRLDEQDVGAALDEAAHLLGVGLGQFAEGDLAGCGVLDVGRHGGRTVRRADRAGDEARPFGVAQHAAVGLAAGQAGRRTGDLAGVGLQPVVGQRHGVGVE